MKKHRYALRKQLSITSIGEESVLLDVSSGQYFGLNELGTIIINGLAQQQSLDNVIDKVVQEFEVSKDQARSDAESLLNELEANGLIISIASNTGD